MTSTQESRKMTCVHCVDKGRKRSGGLGLFSRAVRLGTLIAFAGIVVQAQPAPIPITSCGVLVNSENITLVLNRPLQCTGNFLTITASNVSVLLNGQVVTGPGAGSSIGIDIHPLPGHPTLVNVNIAGFIYGQSDTKAVITNFNNGIQITDCIACSVKSVSASNNTGDGLLGGLAAPGDTRPLHLFSLLVEGCFFNNNQSDGAAIEHSTQATIQNNEFMGNGEIGLSLGQEANDFSTQNFIVNNHADANGGSGIALGRPADSGVSGSTVSTNLLHNNHINGMQVGGVSNIILNNKLFTNSPLDLVDLNPNCGSNGYENNTFSPGKGSPSSCVH